MGSLDFRFVSVPCCPWEMLASRPVTLFRRGCFKSHRMLMTFVKPND